MLSSLNAQQELRLSKVYHVVDFLDDRSTFVVPEWWLQRSRLHITAVWPPYKNTQQVLQAMKRKEQATDSWTQHRVKILHSYATLQQALQKVEDAEETSNLDSDGNEEPIQKRHKKSPHKRPAPQRDAAIDPVLPPFPNAEPSRYEERVYYDLDKGGVQPAMLHEAHPPGCTEMASANGPWHGQDQHEQQPPFSPGVGDPRESGSANILEQMAACREQLEGLAKIVDQQTAFMERMIGNQAEMLMELRVIRRQGVEGGVNVPTLPEGCPHLPVNTTAAMRELNRFLGNREKLQEMAQFFSHMGGYDYKAAARTVLGKLIGQPVALSCSWAGSKGAKEAFCELENIVTLVLVSIQPRYPDANKVSVAAVIKKWLYSAGDRDGGRTKRKSLDGVN